MKVLVTGASGQLGFDVINELIVKGYNVVASDVHIKNDFLSNTRLKRNIEYQCMDITNINMVHSIIDKYKPIAIIHCAAWTAVDLAENNVDLVNNINVNGTKNLVIECRKYNCKFIYISTDYVFNGSGINVWKEDSDEMFPINVYGKSKLEGEKCIREYLSKYFIVRISWAFGLNGNNFVKTMINLGKKYQEIRVVNDQIGTPTYTKDLAKLLVDMIGTEKYGIYHATNEGGFISWYDFACQIFKEVGFDTRVIPVSTEEYGVSKAKRPFNSRLDKSKLTENGFERLPTWQDALKRYLEEVRFLWEK